MKTSVFISILLLFFSAKHKEIRKIQINGFAQGTTYHVTYYAPDSIVVKQQIDSILNKIDSSLSLYKPYSLINQFNSAKEGLSVDDHFKKVVNYALDTYRQTTGYFDITVYPLTDAWGFGPVKRDQQPSAEKVQSLLSCIGSYRLYWQQDKLMKKEPCVQLDANGIAQGYSVDVLADFLERNDIKNYLVELGGEIRIKGRKYPQNEKMTVAIEAPGDNAEEPIIQQKLWIEDGAITTSGTYRRYYETKKMRVSHLMNPLTGYPGNNELISVSVYAKDAMTADAYDNALMIMGLKKALAFIEKRNDMEAFFIYRSNDGTIRDTTSQGFYEFLKP